ncbi:unnamed protein product, partial [Polarella glacialis]
MLRSEPLHFSSLGALDIRGFSVYIRFLKLLTGLAEKRRGTLYFWLGHNLTAMDCSHHRRLVDHYAVLDVMASATMAELRSSYRRMALRTHPDKGGNSEDFRQVLEAFAVLSSSRARAAYDSSIRVKHKGKARLRVLAFQMPRPQREASLQALLPQLRFMQVHGKPEVETPQERVLDDPMALAPVSPGSDSSKSSSGSDESDIDEVLALENEECSMLLAVEDAEDAVMGLGEDDSGDQGESDPDCKLPTAAIGASNRQAGSSGYRGVSRRVDTKTGLITYQAGVIVNHVEARSSYTASAEESVDFHIALVQLRESVEQGVEGADGVEGSLTFEQSFRAAFQQRQEELGKLSLSFSISFRAFGVKFHTPNTTKMEEALEVRSRLLAAREQGVSALQDRGAHGRADERAQEESRSWSLAEATEFVGRFEARCESTQLRRETLQLRQREALEERMRQRRTQKALKDAGKLERRQQRLQVSWRRVVGRAQRGLQQEQRLSAIPLKQAAAAAAEAARAKARADLQAKPPGAAQLEHDEAASHDGDGRSANAVLCRAHGSQQRTGYQPKGAAPSRKPASKKKLLALLHSPKFPAGQAASIVTQLLPYGVLDDAKGVTRVADALVRQKLWQHALSVVCEAHQRRVDLDVIAYSAAASACEKGQQWDLALQVLQSMRSQPVPANVITFSAVMSAA